MARMWMLFEFVCRMHVHSTAMLSSFKWYWHTHHNSVYLVDSYLLTNNQICGCLLFNTQPTLLLNDGTTLRFCCGVTVTQQIMSVLITSRSPAICCMRCSKYVVSTHSITPFGCYVLQGEIVVVTCAYGVDRWTSVDSSSLISSLNKYAHAWCSVSVRACTQDTTT